MRIVAKPVIPSSSTGYSGTPLPKKLGIKEGSGILLVNPPDRFAEIGAAAERRLIRG